jgi:hypothetical protein
VRCPWLLAETKVATIFITFLLEYNPNEPEYNPNEPGYNPNEPEYNPNEPEYNPNEPEYNPNEPEYNPNEPEYNPNEPGPLLRRRLGFLLADPVKGIAPYWLNSEQWHDKQKLVLRLDLNTVRIRFSEAID